TCWKSLLNQKSLDNCGEQPFKYTAEGYINRFKHKLSKIFSVQDHIMAIQKLSEDIIFVCTHFVSEKVKRKLNYSDTYIEEILRLIDETLQNNQDIKTDIEFEVSLKQHICGFAAREFQKMHEDFIQTNDPYRCLEKTRKSFVMISKMCSINETSVRRRQKNSPTNA
uniref:Uncharacterized protein n=1 Tax=Maylandia zebra TaxID=106582 RepID=A0A3P9DSG5_9CICH